MATDQSTQPEQRPEAIDLPRKGTLVLLVEDEREVRRVIRRQLPGVNCLVLVSTWRAAQLKSGLT